MSNAIIGGQITITIGTTPITLTTDDLNTTPLVYSLPPGQTIDLQLGALNTYLNTTFGIPNISFPGITETTLSISTFTISTAGIFDIALEFVFGNGQGWTIFPGLTLNQVGLSVDYSSQPVITLLTPATGPTGTSVVISGNDLATATAVSFGSVSVPPASITNNTATSLTVPVPSGIPAAGNVNVTVTNADGTSLPVVFAYTVS
jgi:hypothetical protein